MCFCSLTLEHLVQCLCASSLWHSTCLTIFFFFCASSIFWRGVILADLFLRFPVWMQSIYLSTFRRENMPFHLYPIPPLAHPDVILEVNESLSKNPQPCLILSGQVPDAGALRSRPDWNRVFLGGFKFWFPFQILAEVLRSNKKTPLSEC